MTKQEFNDLYDSLYYGHDAELEINGQHFFIEWTDVGLEVYALNNNRGIIIASISSDSREKCDVLTELFDFEFIEKRNLYGSYGEMTIVDIE